MLRPLARGAILAAGCAVSLPLVSGCGGPGGPVEGGPVVVVALDGFAWEVIAPLLEGGEYPSIDWQEPVALDAGGGWSARRIATGEAVAPSPGGRWRVADSGSAEPDGLAGEGQLDFPRFDRYRLEGRARSAGPGAGKLTLGVRFSFAGGRPPPRMVGNNETVCKVFETAAEWRDVRLELQPPTTAVGMSLLLLPGEVDCVARRFSRVGAEPGAPIEVEALRLVRGKVRGLPREGFDWAALPAAGNRLPNLARLARSGVSGYLGNIEPTLSPVIWTTVATGVGPEEHGIADFLVPAPGARGKMHVSSAARRTPALWNILTDYGQASVGVVSWWATWPAEAVRGFVLTDHANEGAVRLKEDRGYLPTDAAVRTVYAEYDAYPPEILERLPARRAGGLGRDELERVLPGLDDQTWREISQIAAVDRRVPESLLKFYLLKDLQTLHGALTLFAAEAPDLWMVYFNGQDAMQHRFWHYTDPDLYPRVDVTRLPLYGSLVESYYAMVDGFVGEIAAAAGPEANLIVLSDHGVHGVDFMQAGTKSGGHSWRSRGILVAAGPAFRQGRVSRQASIFDIAPTVLRLLGYPVSTELEGAPLERLLRPEWRRRHPVRTTDGYEFLTPRRGGDAPVERDFDEEITNRLRALGYLE